LGLERRRLERCITKLAGPIGSMRSAVALRLEQALLLDDAGSDVGEPQVSLARRQLEPAECVLLGEVEGGHQQPFCALDELPVLERLLRPIDFGLELAILGMPCGGEPNRSIELAGVDRFRSEEHTSELQSPYDLVCRLLL